MAVKLPIDRGWAWMVLSACFLRAFMVIGMNKAFGMFFVEYIEAFDSSSSMISTVISVQQVMFSLSSFVILTVGSRFLTFRPIVICGSILMAVGYFLTAFAPNVEFLFLSQGILFGIGQAAATGPSIVMLNYYFDKKRGLANSLSNSGGSLGGLLLPLIIQALLETYGLRGAQIVVSGMLLNIVVSGALLRPLKNNIPNEKLNLEVKVQDSNLQNDDENIQIKDGLNYNDISVSVGDRRIHVYKPEEHVNGNSSTFLKLVPENTHRMRTFSENLHKQRYASASDISKNTKSSSCSADQSKIEVISNIYGSLADITSSVQSIFLAKNIDKRSDTHNTEDENEGENETRVSKFCLNTGNFKLLKNHHLKFIYLIGCLAVYGCSLQITYIPPYARDCGISSRYISYLVTIIGACDFAGKFAVAWVADSQRIRINHILSAALTITGVSSMCISVITDFTRLSVYCVIYGLFGGLYNSLLPLLLVECVGAKNLSTAIAFVIQVHGISISSMAPVLGAIRDQTGSYNGSFYIMGAGMLLSAALLLFLEPIVKRLEHKRQERQVLSLNKDTDTNKMMAEN